MKKYTLLLGIFGSLFSPLARANTQPTKKGESRTFLFTHPVNLNTSARRSMWHTFINEQENCHCSNVQVWGVYQTSFSRKKIANYFLFGCKEELLVAGDQSPDACRRDVRAEWLGIDNHEFSGILSIDPKQTQLGIVFDYNINFKNSECLSFLKDYWLTVEIPLITVKNDINLRQHGVHNLGSEKPRDILEAFNQQAWSYAKMGPGQLDIGIGDIAFRFGKTYTSKSGHEVFYYSGFSVPAGKQQNAKFLFDPFLGSNGHFGIIAGVGFQVALNRITSCHSICWFLDMEAIFLMRNSQTRTLDLIGKPWSRYLLLNKKNGSPNQNIPAVNILSQFVRVRPHDLIDFVTGLRIVSRRFEIEMGYGIWGRSDERISLNPDCDFPPIYGIAGISPNIHPVSGCPTGINLGDPCSGGITDITVIPGNNGQVVACNTICKASTASKSTIDRLANTDTDEDGNPIFVPLCESDLDLKSAAAKKSVNHRFHVSFGYARRGFCVDGFIGAGAYYEFPSVSGGLKTGGIWAKCGASF